MYKQTTAMQIVRLLLGLGLDARFFSTEVVRTRGHFRAGFSHLSSDDQIIEVDVPALTSPNLSNFKWSHLPRPVYPLDNDTSWDLV